MIVEIHLRIVGALLMIVALLHSIFPRYFKWKEELARVSLINRQMMYVHSLFLALGVFGMGALCVLSSSELVNTGLGKRVCLGLGVFWVLRLFVQFVGYSSKNWRGKRFETAVHVGMVGLWGYVSGVFLWCAAR